MFFGPQITTVFTSRWKALGWSAGLLLTTYCSIPATDQDDTTGTAHDPAAAAPAAPHTSPWALTPARHNTKIR